MNIMQKRVSMEQIAERLGISAMTVSRALKADSPPQRGKAAKLFHEIRRVAQELGYRKSSAPRMMLTGQYNSIGVLGSNIWRRNYMPQVRLFGMQEAADKHGVSLLFNRIPDENLQSKSYVPEILSNWHSDGLLINYDSNYPKRLDELLTQYRIPAIWMNSKHKSDCIHPDDFEGARSATSFLLKLGHTHIALWINYCSMNDSHYSTLDRKAGYLSAMETAGLKASMMIPDDYITYNEYQDFIESWMNKDDKPPSAIICSGVPQANAVHFWAMKTNIRIPEDLSIICFHNEKDIFQYSTVYIPEEALGGKAVDMIMEKIVAPDIALPTQKVAMELYLPELTCAPYNKK